MNLSVLALASAAGSACSTDTESFSGPIESVDVRPLVIGTTTTNLARGITVQLRAVPVNADGNWVQQAVTWSSSDDARATVDQTGLVTTRAGGDVTISAASGGQTGEFLLNIQFPVGTVTITGNVASIRQEGAVALGVTVLGSNGQPVTGRTVAWTSSNPAVATVNSSTGFVAGLTNGTTTITATSEGVSGTTVVTVNGSPVVSTVTVTPGTPFLGVGMTQQFTQTPRAGSGTIIVGTVPVWSSSSPAVATVNAATGLVTVVGAGKTTISAVVDNGLGANVTGSTEIEAAPQLTRGMTVAVPTLAAGSGFALYAYNVPAGATSFSVTTTGGTGDADLYLFQPGVIPSAFNGNAFPPWSNTTTFSGNSGNGESASRTTSLPGVWRVYAHAWAGGGAVAGLTLTATHTP
ncbi:MAG: Ig-like domain-containing protein [Gemmatimonadota bacterium]|nr:Ig-like domain-containing protein [Gemmatimonadota bacterium]